MIMAISTEECMNIEPSESLSQGLSWMEVSRSENLLENLLDSFLQNDFIYFSVKLGAFAGNEYISHQI